MIRSKIVLLFVVSFLGGIICGEFFLDNDWVKVIALCIGGGWMLWKFFHEQDFRIAVIISLIGIFCGIFRFLISFDGGEGHVSNFEGFVSIRGCISEEVDVRNDKVKYILEVNEVSGKETHGRVLVSADRYPVYEYGDCMTVSGKLERPEKIEDFAYDKYLARYDIYSVIYRGQISDVENGGLGFFKGIFYVKGLFESQLMKVFAEPHASFMGGLILGSRKGIPAHLMEDFNTTGLTHIIAISGYNITLIIVIVSGIFGFLSRRKKVIASSIFVVLFVILVGASSAVVRAGIMGIISLIALWFGRQYQVTLALFMAAFLMNLWNPKILVYDVGFQLSFMATAGLLYVSPLLEKYFMWLPEKFGIRESLLMTLSAQVLALPIIIYNFERLSLISPIANLFVLPFIPLAMIFGFFSVTASVFWNFLGNLVGVFGYIVLEIIIFSVKMFASIGFASIEISFFSWWMVLTYYLFLVNKVIRI